MRWSFSMSRCSSVIILSGEIPHFHQQIHHADAAFALQELSGSSHRFDLQFFTVHNFLRARAQMPATRETLYWCCARESQISNRKS